MAYGDNDNRINHAASRPPESDNGEIFQEIPIAMPRRTQSGGRPVNYPERNFYAPRPENVARRAPTAPVNNTKAQFTELSWGNRPQGQKQRASFTEISWDSLRSGEAPSSAARFTAPAAPEAPRSNGASSYSGSLDDFARTPAPRQARRQEDTFVDPFRELDPTAYERSVPNRPVKQPEMAPPPEMPPVEAPRSAHFVPPTRPVQPISHPRADINRPAAPRTAARHAAPARPYYPPVIPEVNNDLPPEAWAPRPRPVVKKRGIHPAFYVIGALLAFLIILGISKAVKAIGNNAAPKTPKAADVTAAPKAATPTPEAEATPSPEPTPTPAPTATPTGAKAGNANGYIAPADWGVVLWPREKAVYDSFFDNSVMIGNSLVEGFFMYSGLSNIKYIYNTGAVINKVFGYLDLYPLEVNTYNNVYLMFGLNEVGSDVESFISNYASLIDYVREHQPKTNIIAISVTPVTKGVDEDPNEAQSMERIKLFNDRLQQLCKEKECWYLDIYSMLLDGEGYLSADYAYAGDGKHFEKSGYVAWANYMKNHYVDDGLLR